jgi:hypothetical protein
VIATFKSRRKESWGVTDLVKLELYVKVIALDLEGTLISNAMSQIARPWLHEFLESCRSLCDRIVIFTTVEENVFRKIAALLVDEKLAPLWFKDAEYIQWAGETKDLSFIKHVDISQVVLVDDFSGYIHPDQRSRWIEVKQFCHPYGPDEELKIVLQKLITYM